MINTVDYNIAKEVHFVNWRKFLVLYVYYLNLLVIRSSLCLKICAGLH